MAQEMGHSRQRVSRRAAWRQRRVVDPIWRARRRRGCGWRHAAAGAGGGASRATAAPSPPSETGWPQPANASLQSCRRRCARRLALCVLALVVPPPAAAAGAANGPSRCGSGSDTVRARHVANVTRRDKRCACGGEGSSPGGGDSAASAVRAHSLTASAANPEPKWAVAPPNSTWADQSKAPKWRRSRARRAPAEGAAAARPPPPHLPPTPRQDNSIEARIT